MTSLSLLAPPEVEPVSVAELKAYLRVESSDEDALLGGMITAARQVIERHLRRVLIRQSWRLALDPWPVGPLRLPRPPLMAVDAVRQRHDDGSETLFDPSTYRVETRAEPGFVLLKDVAPVLPVSAAHMLEIDFTAGYGSSWNDVPAPIRQACLVMAGQMAENRGSEASALSSAVAGLIAPYRMVSL